MGEIVITTSGFVLSIATLPEALGLAVVILALGAAGAIVAYAITRYSDVDIHFKIEAQDLVRYFIQMST